MEHTRICGQATAPSRSSDLFYKRLSICLVEKKESQLPLVPVILCTESSSQFQRLHRHLCSNHDFRLIYILTSPETSTNSFSLLATVKTGMEATRAFICGKLAATSNTGCGLRGAARPPIDRDCINTRCVTGELCESTGACTHCLNC